MVTKVVEGLPGAPAPGRQQFVLINLLKGVAAQLIVLHHLAFYGPMADHAQPLLPLLVGWLDEHARIAVQVFLVVGGFLAAKSLSPTGLPGIDHPLRLVWRRYVKLAPPFVAATLLAILASSWAGAWMTHDSISAPPTLFQIGAHALLLHSVLGVESIAAGAWYVAIDFQLYALMTLLAWLSGRLAGARPLAWLMPVLVLGGVAASLLYFNLDAGWDVWAPYFFGSYGLGVLAWWASDPARRAPSAALLVGATLVLFTLALALDFRNRIAVALAVACALFLCGRLRASACPGGALALASKAGQISFAVFLVHFPVCLLVNAAFVRFAPAQEHVQALGMLVAWGASVLAGAAFYRWIELPLGRMLAPGPALAAGQRAALKTTPACGREIRP